MQRRKFSREFKLEAVKLVRERGVELVKTVFQRQQRVTSERDYDRLFLDRQRG